MRCASPQSTRESSGWPLTVFWLLSSNLEPNATQHDGDIDDDDCDVRWDDIGDGMIVEHQIPQHMDGYSVRKICTRRTIVLKSLVTSNGNAFPLSSRAGPISIPSP